MERERARSRNRMPAPEIQIPAANNGPVDEYGRSIPAEETGRRRSWFARHKVLSFFLTLALILLVAGGVLLAAVILNPGALLINRGNGGDSQQAGYTFPKDVVNILILGTDADTIRIKEGMNARTDCVMLASINTTTKKVSLISIPRDTYVDIYDENNKAVAKNRINAAFAFGGGLKKQGIAYTMNTVSQFLGGKVPIDHYVLFDMDLVSKLIDAVGGVTVDVDITLDFHSVHLRPGKMKLNGFAALTYARDRHNTAGGDFGRVGHQQQVMIALLRELQNKGNIVKKIPELYGSLSNNVTTDPGLGPMQVAALAWIAKDVDSKSIKQYTIHGQCLTIKGASIVVADQDDKKKMLKEVFGIDYQIRQDETYDFLKGDISDMLNAGKSIVNSAQSLLNNNKQYYSADEARALRAAIAAWQAASKKNDGDGMQDAQQDVQTEYEILKNLIDQRKAAPSDTPAPADTPDPADTQPPENTVAPEQTPEPTESPAQEVTAAPTDSPAPEATASPAPEQSPPPSST